MKDVKVCPNCEHESLHLVGEEWVCTECEYHTENSKPAKGSFR